MKIAKLNRFIDEWIIDYKSGLSTRKIAAKYGVSKSIVQTYLSKEIVLRTHREVQMGHNNSNWGKGEITMSALHSWLRRNLPKPELCSGCKAKEPLDVANISPTYNATTYTRDLKNWEWLCRSCHMIKDGRLEKMRSKRQPLITHRNRI